MVKRLTPNKIRQRLIEKGFDPLFKDEEYFNTKTKIKIRCKCGNIFYTNYNRIQNNNTKSCGHCSLPKIGEKYGTLTIEKVTPAISRGCSVICKCDCGRIWGPERFSVLSSGNTKSCGSCKQPKIGDRFGNLVVIEIFDNSNGGQVKAKCDCGRVWGPGQSKFLTGKNTTSCGNCGLQRNGRLTSNIALELHKIIEKILNKTCEHNYYIKGRCFDIVCPELKIVIEYDGYYWHRIYRNTTKSEERDERLLKKEEYKFLRIRSSGDDMPTEDQLRKVLTNHFEHDYKKWTITMKSWKNKLERRRL